VTIHDLVADGRQRLKNAGIPEAEAHLDARVLAQHSLGWDAAQFFIQQTEPADQEIEAGYRALVQRRAAREPMAYVVGHQEFWGLTFDVSPATLIPRPETELIVEAALDHLSQPGAAASILDIGTGTGCLAVSLAVERPSAHVIASDISADALDVARRNAQRHGVADRIHFVRSDLFGNVPGRFDLIVSNPPYVAERDRGALQPEVRDHEPATALFGGSDGLEVIRRLVSQTADHLISGGLLIFEFGLGQEEAIEGLIGDSPNLRMVGLKHDLQGIPRTAIACRAEA
jgi:release factor glutamine methyltransferase